jgi:hypothetical protein
MSFRAEHSHLRDFGVTTQIQITVTVYAISTAPAVAALVPVPFAAWPPWVASRDYRVNCHRNPIAHYIENGNNRFGESRAYFFLAARPARAAELAATAARMSCWKAASSIFSPFAQVDRTPRVPFQAGIEELLRVFDGGSAGKGELHDLLVRFPCADDAVM